MLKHSSTLFPFGYRWLPAIAGCYKSWPTYAGWSGTFGTAWNGRKPLMRR